MFVDYHVHTDYSDDSDYSMEDVVKDAIRMGMDEICFTDHVDYGAKVDWERRGDSVLCGTCDGKCGLSGLCGGDSGTEKPLCRSDRHQNGAGVWYAGSHDTEI